MFAGCPPTIDMHFSSSGSTRRRSWCGSTCCSSIPLTAPSKWCVAMRTNAQISPSPSSLHAPVSVHIDVDTVSRVQDDIKNRRKFLRRCEYPGEDVDVQTRHAWRGSSSERNSADRARVSWKGGVRQAPTLRQPARADAVFAVFFQESRSMIYTLGQQ